MMDKRLGELHAIVGPMASGKSAWLCEMDAQLKEAGKSVVAYKHSSSSREEGDSVIKSRNGEQVECIPFDNLLDILIDVEKKEPYAILIDEIQFFECDPYILEDFLFLGVNVFVFGLDLDSNYEVFGSMGDILALSDSVTKLTTKCKNCGGKARTCKYEGEGEPTVGDLDVYTPLCRSCMFGVGYTQPHNPIHVFNLHSDGLTVDIAIDELTLLEAGYTVDQVEDIQTLEGIYNFLEDITMGDDLSG